MPLVVGSNPSFPTIAERKVMQAKRTRVTVNLTEAMLQRMEKEARSREMSLGEFLQEVIEMGFRSMSYPPLRAETGGRTDAEYTVVRSRG